MAADLLTTIRSELDARLSELRPLMAEYERLLAAVDALGLASADPPTAVEVSSQLPAAVVDTPVSSSPRRRGRPRGSAAGAIKAAVSGPLAAAREEASTAADLDAPTGTDNETSSADLSPAKTKSARAPRGAARQAILAALEHGSHTVAELAVVTAMSGPNITVNLRRMLQESTIKKTQREGKTAYALSAAG